MLWTVFCSARIWSGARVMAIGTEPTTGETMMSTHETALREVNIARARGWELVFRKPQRGRRPERRL